nr:ATP synthase F0 subunit 8 [Dimorphopteryx sp. 1 GYN-2021]
MPQMFPLNWVALFVYFILIFIMFNILNFYLTIIFKNNKSSKKLFYLNKNYLNWKW